MTATRTDVLVVGGGPAGATAAFQLAGAGVRVTLIDRATFPREKPCGESLSPGALVRLRAIGIWPLEAPPGPTPAIPIRGMRIRSPRGIVFFGRYRSSPASPGLVIRRISLDSELVARARARGVRVMEGVEALSAEEVPGGAIVHVRATGSSTRVGIEATRVVVADGRRSFLARQFGFLEPAPDGGRHRRYAVRAHCDNVEGLTDLAEMHVGDRGYCGVAPLSPTSANICYVLFQGRLQMTPRTIEADFRRDLKAYPEIDHRLRGACLTDQISVVGPLRLKSRRQATGPFIACGDTTGFLDPFTGEGIAHAIASGTFAAEAVRSSLDGSGTAFTEYEMKLKALRRVKGAAALILYGLVRRRVLADSTATLLSRLPRLGNALVRLFGDQV